MIFLLLLTLTQQAQTAWQERDKPGQTEKAIQFWDEAANAEPERGELWTDLAKALGRAVRHAKTSKERQKWADQARSAAEMAIKKSPKSAQALATYGEAMGQWADAHKGVHSLGAVKKAVAALKKSVSLDPQYAYAHMLLASFYREAPSVISVRNRDKALAEAKLAVQYGPGYAVNHLVLARTFLDLGNKKEAIQQLQTILTLSPPDDAVPETRADQETAQQMLQSLGVGTPQCGDTGGVCSEQP